MDKLQIELSRGWTVFSVSDTDYGTLLEGKEVTVTYYYINDTEYWESCILVIGNYEFNLEI